MTPELVDDLKQFIEAAFVQQMSGINARFDAIDRRFEAVDHRFEAVDRRFAGIDQRLDDFELKLDTVIDTFGTMLVDHDNRLGALEASKA